MKHSRRRQCPWRTCLFLVLASSSIAVSSAFLSSFRAHSRPAFFLHTHHHVQDIQQKYNLTLCLVDHYDSYTYNLYDMLASLCLEPPLVVAKDYTGNALNEMDGFVLSPGPGRPPLDTGISLELIQNHPTTPILGVCLGHQALGYAYGAQVVEAQEPVHGQIRPVVHDDESSNCPLWKNVSSPLQVVRYHSLVVQEWKSGKVPLVATAWCQENDTDSKTIMGLAHTRHPHYGLQFHPESIGTQEGYQLLENFLQICETEKVKREGKNNAVHAAVHADMTNYDVTVQHVNGETKRDNVMIVNGKSSRNGVVQVTQNEGVEEKEDSTATTGTTSLQVEVRKVCSNATPVDVYTTLYSNATHSVWLDSSSSSIANEENDMSRFSIMAAMDGPLSRRMEYNGEVVRVYASDGSLQREETTDILSFLERELSKMSIVDDETLPFEYRGGYLGYLGYEVRHDTRRALEQLEHGLEHDRPSGRNTTNVPTAAFLFCDQSLVYDHWKKEWYMVGVAGSDTKSISEWMNRTEHAICSVESHLTLENDPPTVQQPLAFVPNRSPEIYRENIASCHEQIRLGETYELCLTNQLEATVPFTSRRTPLHLYKILRQRNPVPFAAFLNFRGQGDCASLSICCSSPERFVSVKKRPPSDAIRRTNDGVLHVEAKPIKGTCARQVIPNGRARTEAESIEDKRRARELEMSIKNRAENLMIVDLLRNDLNRVCQVGSVHVPKLMQIESYATVHQMVSTIRGTLDPSKANAINVLSACFPGGSMTGAPKLRTMEILDELEEGVERGPYSGCLGYISLNGSMDMNIIIRSAVLTPEEDGWKVRVGAGGAITALSESEDEYEEMLLKARAVVEAVQLWANLAPERTSKSKVAKPSITITL